MGEKKFSKWLKLVSTHLSLICLFAVNKMITFISKRSKAPGQEEGVWRVGPGTSEPRIEENHSMKSDCFF